MIEVGIECGNEIVIRIPLVHLPQLLAVADWNQDATSAVSKVTDPLVFAEALVNGLIYEEEGQTPVRKLIQDSMAEAIEQGAEGVD